MAVLRGVNRRRFLELSTLAAGAGLGGLFGQTEEAAAATVKPGDYDQTFLHKKAGIRQIWDFTTVDQVQTGVGAMKNAMNAFQFFYRKSHYLLINLRGPSAVIYALDDAMWAKYTLGAKYQVFDPAAPGSLARRNPLFARLNTDNGMLSPDDPKSLYQDATLQAFQQRGAHISACHDALGGQAALAVTDNRAQGLTAAQVYQDLVQHLVPGAQQTPSGSSLIAVAQQVGFTYAKQ
jgi:hypothetical protein